MGKTSPKYRPLYTTDKFFIYLQGGRGSAKSYEAAEFAVRLTYETGHVILYTRYTLTAADKSVIPEFNEKIEALNLHNDFEVTKTEIINKQTGSRILFAGIKTSSGNQTANLKSLTGVTTWIYDEFEEHPDFETFDKVVLSVRQKHVQNRVILVSNALHKKSWQYDYFFKERRDDVEYIETTYLDNIENLSNKFINTAEETKKSNIDKYNRDFLGLHYDTIHGALWKSEMIKYGKEFDFKRKIVAVDPAVTAHKDSDETGIIVIGYIDNKAYIIEDLSGVYSPDKWANVVARAYNMHDCDRVIAEVNNGGDLVESNLRSIDRNISYKAVRASKGKFIRAEPIAALYEQGKVFHCEKFAKLEHQMTTWTPLTEKSPDRVDALVWGLTELMIKQKEMIVI